MTKKSKSRSKVATNTSVSANETKEGNTETSELLADTSTSGAYSLSSASSNVKNGKIAAVNNSKSTTLSLGSIPSVGSGPSLASIPGIVDDFLPPKVDDCLPPKFVKVLNFRDRGYERNPPPSLAEYKKSKAAATDSNANKVKSTDAEPTSGNNSDKKNKRKKSKPVKNTNANLTTCYDDSEDGRELDVLNSGRNSTNHNGNGSHHYSDPFQNDYDNPSGLSSKDMSNLARMKRIRHSATNPLRYEGNNIVLVGSDSNDGAQYPTTSCYDDYNYNYDADELVAGGGGPGSASVPLDEASTLGYLDHDDDDDEDERVGSWSIAHNSGDYSYSCRQQATSSVASSESENTGSSFSTTASGSNPSIIEGRRYPSLASCHSFFDGLGQACAIKDCSQPATKKCSQCKKAYYCSEEHQRNDWKKHKGECIPYRMESKFGDDVSNAVAAKDIPPGQTIFSEKPLLFFALADPDNDFLNVMDVPCIRNITNKNRPTKSCKTKGNQLFSCSAIKPACLGCLRSVEFIGPPRSNCSTCKLPLCSYKCYLDPFHQATECHVVSRQGGWTEEQHKCYHSLYMDIEILRALQLESRDQSKWERFLELKQNLRVEAYKTSEKYHRFIENYKELVPISAKISGYHDDLIGNVHAIITSLCFKPSLKSTYKLLFATQILFAHDCIPNTFHYLEESLTGKVDSMMLVTKAAVPILKKEIITIDFCPTPYLYYPLRRMVLRNVLSIENCSCKRCQAPGSVGDYSIDVKCPRCRDVICPECPTEWQNSVWACKGCLEEFSYSMILKITQECRDELATIISQPKQFVIPALKQFITQKEDQHLHSGHSIIIQAWSFIEASLRPSLVVTRSPGPCPIYPEHMIEDYRLLGRCCDAIEKHLEGIRPGICYERGFMYLNRYYVNLALSAKRFNLRLLQRRDYITELMQCMKLLQEALKIFQMFEGYNREQTYHAQECTSMLVTTKTFIQEQMMTDNEETKTKKTNATVAAINSTAKLLRDTL